LRVPSRSRLVSTISPTPMSTSRCTHSRASRPLALRPPCVITSQVISSPLLRRRTSTAPMMASPPKRFTARVTSSGSSTAAVFSITLSAPLPSMRWISGRPAMPPPAITGTKTRSETFLRIAASSSARPALETSSSASSSAPRSAKAVDTATGSAQLSTFSRRMPLTTRPRLMSRQGMMRRVVATSTRRLDHAARLAEIDVPCRAAQDHAGDAGVGEPAGGFQLAHGVDAHRLREFGELIGTRRQRPAFRIHVLVDETVDAVVLKMPREADDVVVGELGVRITGQAAVAHVHLHEDVAGKFQAKVLEHVRRGGHAMSEHQPVGAGVEMRLHQLLVVHTAHHLQLQVLEARHQLLDDGQHAGLLALHAVLVDELHAPDAMVHEPRDELGRHLAGLLPVIPQHVAGPE